MRTDLAKTVPTILLGVALGLAAMAGMSGCRGMRHSDNATFEPYVETAESVSVPIVHALGLGRTDEGNMTVDGKGVLYKTKGMPQQILISWDAVLKWKWLEYNNALEFSWRRDRVPEFKDFSNIELEQVFSFRIAGDADKKRAVGIFLKYAMDKEKGSVPRMRVSGR